MATAEAAHPRFRQDLVAEAIEDGGTKFIDVMDPDTGNVFRFYEVEYSLACAMDGERDVAGIVRWANEELGLQPSAQEVSSVIATLGDLGFLGADADHDQSVPTAADELATGVVVGKQAAAPSAADVELGASGPSAPSGTSGGVSRPTEPAPAAASFDLGAPGKSAQPVATKAPAAEDIALGAPGRSEKVREPEPPEPQSDVSIDLSEHIAVRPQDVKEAVRQSKVMSAVEVPKDLLDALESAEAAEPPAKAPEAPKPAAPAPTPAPAPVAAKAPEPKPEPKPDAAKVEDPAVAAAAAAAAAASAVAAAAAAGAKSAAQAEKKPAEKAKAPIAMPSQPAKQEAKQPEAKPAKKTSPVLVILLVLVVLGAGAYLVKKYVLDAKQDDKQAEKAPTPPPAPPTPPPAPPAPPPPSTKLALTTPDAVDVKTDVAGNIESTAADGSDVKAGDVLVTFAGGKPIEAEIAALERDEKRVQGELDAATRDRDAAQAAGNQAGVSAAQARVDDRTKSLQTKQATHQAKSDILEKLKVKAPSDGKAAIALKAGQAATAGAVVAKVTPAPLLAGTFTVSGSKLAPQSAVVLGIKNSERTLPCTVLDVSDTAVRVGCPADSSIVDGTEVTLPAQQ